MWFRHLEFTEQISDKNKQKNLKNINESLKLSNGGSSASYLQKSLFESHKYKDPHANEWFVLENCGEELKSLCKELNDEKKEMDISTKSSRNPLAVTEKHYVPR